MRVGVLHRHNNICFIRGDQSGSMRHLGELGLLGDCLATVLCHNDVTGCLGNLCSTNNTWETPMQEGGLNILQR